MSLFIQETSLANSENLLTEEPSTARNCARFKSPPLNEILTEEFARVTDRQEIANMTDSLDNNTSAESEESSFDWTNIVTVKIGPNEFRVHKGHLCETSPFFRRAFSQVEQEGEKKSVELSSESSAIFQIFVNWLYRRQIEIPESSMGSDGYSEPIQAYVLANKLESLDFKDSVIDAIISRSNETTDGSYTFPNSRSISYAYKHTTSRSPLRRALVYIWGQRATPMSLTQASVKEWDQEFLYALSVRWYHVKSERTSRTAPIRVPSCDFYSHGDHQCYKDKHAK